MISPLFTTIVLLSVFIWIFMKASAKKTDGGISEFLEREREANSVRRQSLDSLDFVSIPTDIPPIPDPVPNERIAELYETISILSSKKIVNLTGISNTDLKFRYGQANLPTLTEYDQNFTLLARTLYDLGVELNTAGLTDEAVSVLKAGILVGSDISGNYTYLAEIYSERKDYAAINGLITTAQSIRSLTKNSTISKLYEILDNNTSSVIQLNDSSDTPDNILPKDILDTLESVPYISSDQKQ